jgi:hypothetical protein
MHEDRDRAGLGKIVYSVENGDTAEEQQEERAERAELDEADRESFPASDPPGFAGGRKPEPSTSPDDGE